MQTAYFAAGCFWGVQFYFDQVPGVNQTEVGYTGGHTKHPTYDAVCSHTTGHAEAVRVVFDPTKISYDVLLQHFFRMHDPTQLNRQGPDVGDSYRSAIFYNDEAQRIQAEAIIAKLNEDAFDHQIVTTLELFDTWWPAEAFHQKFAERTGQGMCHIPYKALQ